MKPSLCRFVNFRSKAGTVHHRVYTMLRTQLFVAFSNKSCARKLRSYTATKSTWRHARSVMDSPHRVERHGRVTPFFSEIYTSFRGTRDVIYDRALVSSIYCIYHAFLFANSQIKSTQHYPPTYYISPVLRLTEGRASFRVPLPPKQDFSNCERLLLLGKFSRRFALEEF